MSSDILINSALGTTNPTNQGIPATNSNASSNNDIGNTQVLGQFATLLADMMSNDALSSMNSSLDSDNSSADDGLMNGLGDTSGNDGTSGAEGLSSSSQMLTTLMMLLASELDGTNAANSPSTLTGDSGVSGVTAPGSTVTSNASAAGSKSMDPATINTAIQNASTTYGVPANLIRAVIQQESGMNPDAVSSAGAIGLMQLMPDTASSLGVTNPYDPVQNINGGTEYLSNLLQQFSGNTQMALAAYNAGPGAVEANNGIPPYPETTSYVNNVLSYAKQFEPTYA